MDLPPILSPTKKPIRERARREPTCLTFGGRYLAIAIARALPDQTTRIVRFVSTLDANANARRLGDQNGRHLLDESTLCEARADAHVCRGPADRRPRVRGGPDRARRVPEGGALGGRQP